MKYILIIMLCCSMYSSKGQTRVVMIGPPGDPSKGGLTGLTGCTINHVCLPNKIKHKRRRINPRWVVEKNPHQ